jgi:hypothetical protein
VIVPGVRVACTITCARPLNKFRFGSLSDSWQLGSPLPTPISLPSPVTFKLIMLSGVGIMRPSLSRTSTRRTDTSSPCGVDFAAVRGEANRPRVTGGLALFDEHHFAVFCAAGLEHAGLVFDFPVQMRERLHFLRALALWFRKTSTESRFECTHAEIGSPSR